MAAETLPRIGRIWFQNRSIALAPLVLVMPFLRPDFVPTTASVALTWVGIALAELIRIWAVGFAGSATRTRGDSVPRIVHAGPYRLVRNPLYLANISLYVLAPLLFGYAWLSLIVGAVSIVQYTCIVAYEETLLDSLFGTPYRRYKELVPRWMGSLRPRIESTPHSFDLIRALRSERSTLIAIAALLAVWFAVTIAKS